MALDLGWRVYSGETGHWYGDVRTEALADALAQFAGESRAVVEQIVEAI